MDLAYRIVNVFTVGDDPFSGNQLAVVENAGDLDGTTMQSIARQFNLSETTFVTALTDRDHDGVDATVRIFTRDYEMPFAGHPTLGTAHVVAALTGRDDVVLGMRAGPVAVTSQGTRWRLTAAVAPSVRDVELSTEELAALLGIDAADIGEGAAWVDTGVEQLMIPLTSVEAVRRADADAGALRRLEERGPDEVLVFLWASPPDDESRVEARMFFRQGSGVVEDPATGSAAANLGGWLHARGARDLARDISQGAAVQRPSALRLEVDADGGIQVSGTVRELGAGVLSI